jgi:hypothetical protein
VRTRLYFTSESHVHALLNVLRYGCPDRAPVLADTDRLGAIAELNYLSTIVFHVYERVAAPADDRTRFRVTVSLSPGSDADPFIDDGTAPAPATLVVLSSRLALADLELFLKDALAAGTVPS